MKVASLLLMVLLTACASETVEPNYYLLRSDQVLPSGALTTSKDFSLGNVEIAAYLDQPGVVVETADGQILAASQNLWAEPVYDGIRNFLATEIAKAYGQELLPTKLSKGATAVDIRIDQLHGTLDGSVHLAAYWSLVRDGKAIALHRFVESRNLASSGYLGLVDAEQGLLAELAKNMDAILTHDELLARVWGEEYRGSSHYLHVYFGRIRKKMGDVHATLLESVPGVGYILHSTLPL